ncbi:MAG: DUF2177 family protein [Bacteriovoracaceae bacterium]|nr:DUF2177 family protein [Bacteriovoracaceae bacterium]
MEENFFKVIAIAATSFCLTGYLFSRLFKRNDVADILWGLGFLLVATLSILFAGELTFKAKFVLVLVGIWSTRLSFYLFFRTIKKTEDIRYANWRKDWGNKEPLYAFLKVFLLQSILMVLIAYPLALIVLDKEMTVGPLDFAGLSLFIIGFLFESIGDYQLSCFKKNPSNRGRIMSTGLWGYTRHPNYLGEVLIWWGFFCFTLSSAWWPYTLLSPILLTFLITKVSGITMLENLLKEKGEDFRLYTESVPALFPFKKRHFIIFTKALAVTLFLDFLWLGTFLNDFYISQSQHLARVVNGKFDAVLWATILVYIFIPLGIVYFSVLSSKSRSMALFKGSIFGLVLYTVYEFTNIALISDWPIEMALIDILWGPILCGLTALLSYTETKKE